MFRLTNIIEQLLLLVHVELVLVLVSETKKISFSLMPNKSEPDKPEGRTSKFGPFLGKQHTWHFVLSLRIRLSERARSWVTNPVFKVRVKLLVSWELSKMFRLRLSFYFYGGPSSPLKLLNS